MWGGGWTVWSETLEKVYKSCYVSIQIKEGVEKIYWGSWGAGIGIVIGVVIVGMKWRR
jgi:ABC-type transport system involved in cytochrome c biogenesis permease subunit